MSEKLYKLKEEVKKYFNNSLADKILSYNYNNNEQECWHYLNVSKEALEEVEEKIRIVRIREPYQYSGIGISGRDITNSEGKDIETFLNEYKTIENLHDLIKRYVWYIEKKTDRNEAVIFTFKQWLKKINK